MRDYFLRRFLLIPPTLLGITLIVFLITRVVPGGPIERALMEARMGDTGGAQTNQIGSGAISEEQMAQLKAYYGFDKPPLEAYLLWLGKVVRGDLGNSYRYNEPVLHIIADRLPVSLLYGLVTTLLVSTHHNLPQHLRFVLLGCGIRTTQYSYLVIIIVRQYTTH